MSRFYRIEWIRCDTCRQDKQIAVQLKTCGRRAADARGLELRTCYTCRFRQVGPKVGALLQQLGQAWWRAAAGPQAEFPAELTADLTATQLPTNRTKA